MSSEYSIQMILFETQKYIYVPNIELLLLFFFLTYGHIHSLVSTLPNFAEVDVENDNVVLTTLFCSNQRQNGQRWFDVAQY